MKAAFKDADLVLFLFILHLYFIFVLGNQDGIIGGSPLMLSLQEKPGTVG